MANKFLIKRGDESPNDSTIDNYELVYNYTDNELWTKHNGSVVKISSGTNGTVTNVVAGNGLTGGGQTTATLALDFSQLTDMTGNISGTTEFILQNGTVESRKAASEIKLTAFDATGFSISGAVDTSGTPIAQEYARFTDANTVEGRSAAGVRTDLGLVVGTNVQAQDDLLQNIADFPTSSSSNDGKVVTYQDSNGSLVLSTPSVGTITSVTGMTDNNVLTASGSTTISGEGSLTFNGSHLKLLVDGGKFLAGANEDAYFMHSGSHGWLNNSTGNLYIRNQTDDGQIIMQTDDGTGNTTTYMSLKGNEQLIRFLKSTRHNDGVVGQFGTSADLRIYHNANGNSNIENHSADLYFTEYTDDGSIYFRSDNGSSGVANYLQIDGNTTNLLLTPPSNITRIANDGGASDEPKLQLYRNNAAYGQVHYEPGGGSPSGLHLTDFRDDANSHIIFNTRGDNERMRIESDGKVGIGVVSPQQKLHIFQTEGGVGAKHATIRLGGYSTVGAEIAAYRHTGNSNDQGLIFSTYHNTNGTTDTMTLDSNGLVGIGTASPSSKLEVSHVQNAESLLTLHNNRQDASNVPIFGIAGKQSGTIVGKMSFYRGGGGNSGYITFSTKVDNSASLTEKMRLDGAGRLGIGITDPWSATVLDLGATSNNMRTGNKIYFYDSNKYIGRNGSDIQYYNNHGNHRFYKSTTEIARIDSIRLNLYGTGSSEGGEIAFHPGTSGSYSTVFYLDSFQNKLRVHSGGVERFSVNTSGVFDIPGSLTLGTALAIAEGGTGATSAHNARIGLGLGTLATLSQVDAATIADNEVGADELTVSGDGTNGQYLASNGSGGFNWISPVSNSNASTLDTLDSTQFLRSDTGDTAAGNITFTGKLLGNTLTTAILNGTNVSNVNDGFTNDIATSKNSGLQPFRYSNNSTNTPLGGGSSMANNANWGLSLYSHQTGGGGNYGLQMSGGDNDNQLFFIRRVTNGSFGSWFEMWHSGNDGSGSGLDADLLDGIQASGFTRAGVESGTPNTAANKTTFTCNDAIETSSGNQSGLQVWQDTSGADAFMTFHVAGDYAGYFGLDGSTNDLSWGGWSNGNGNKYRVFHAGNSTNITSVGTINTGVWNGTAIASAYLDADTAHLSTTQTFTGAKTFGTQTWNGHITWNNGMNIGVAGESSIDVSGSGYFQVWDSGTGSPFLKCDVGQQVEIGQAGSRGLKVHGNSFINGQLRGGFGAQSTSGTTDWNHSTNARSGNGHTLLLSTHTNGPGTTTVNATNNHYYHLLNFEYAGYDNDGNMTQLAFPYSMANNDGARPVIRTRYGGTWSSYNSLVTANANGQIQAGMGTAALPSITFNGGGISDTNTGILRTAADTIGFSTNGVTRFTMNGGGVLYVSSHVQAGSGGIQIWDGTHGFKTVLAKDSTYTKLLTNDGNVGIHLGDSGDGTNYYNSGTHRFRNVSGSEYMRIQSGNISGVGSNLSLRRANNNDDRITIEASEQKFIIDAVERLSLTSSGATVTGNVSASADVIAYASSDKRLKDNLKPIENPLDKVSKLSGYEFDWNDKQETYQGHDVGVVAQEVEEVIPEIVTTRDNGYKAVKYEKLVPLLIESIKELKEEINGLKTKLGE